MSSSLVQPPNRSEYPWPAAVLQCSSPFLVRPGVRNSPVQIGYMVTRSCLRLSHMKGCGLEQKKKRKEKCQLLHLARWLPPSPKRKQPLLSVRRPKVYDTWGFYHGPSNGNRFQLALMPAVPAMPSKATATPRRRGPLLDQRPLTFLQVVVYLYFYYYYLSKPSSMTRVQCHWSQ